MKNPNIAKNMVKENDTSLTFKIVVVIVAIILSIWLWMFLSYISGNYDSYIQYRDAKIRLTNYCLDLNGCQVYSCLATISSTYQAGSYYLLKEQNCLIKESK
jgi:hypothetical protein